MRIPLSEPAGWMTAYRGSSAIGLFIRFTSDQAHELYLALKNEMAQSSYPGLELTFDDKPADPKGPMLGVSVLKADFPDPESQLAWLKRMANTLVNILRPRIAGWVGGT